MYNVHGHCTSYLFFFLREEINDAKHVVPAEQQGGVAMKKATLSSRSLPAPMATAAGGVVTPELRTVPGGDANPSHGSIRQERTSPAEAVAAAGSAARPELRTTPWGSNPLHNR